MTTSKAANEALAPFLVEALDGEAQFADRFGEVVALGDELGIFLLDLGEFLVGAQIDGAEPLAIGAQVFERPLDLVDLGQVRARLHAGELAEALRLAVELARNRVHERRVALAQGFDARFGAGALLARGGHRVERAAGEPVGLREIGFGRRALVARQPAPLLRLVDFVDQRAPPGEEQIGRFGERLLFGCRLRPCAPRIRRSARAPAWRARPRTGARRRAPGGGAP